VNHYKVDFKIAKVLTIYFMAEPGQEQKKARQVMGSFYLYCAEGCEVPCQADEWERYIMSVTEVKKRGVPSDQTGDQAEADYQATAP